MHNISNNNIMNSDFITEFIVLFIFIKDFIAFSYFIASKDIEFINFVFCGV